MISGDAWSVFLLLALVILWAVGYYARDREEDEKRKSIEFEIFKPTHPRERDIVLNLMIEGYKPGASLSGVSLLEKFISTFPNVQTTHPPWQVGQHVSYFRESEDGRWTAIRIQVADRTDEGEWILCADFKTASGECTLWLVSNTQEDEKSPYGFGRFRQEEVRQWSPADEMDDFDDPGLQTSMALNLLLVRQNLDAIATYKTEPLDVLYPCDIDKVHRYTMELPDFLKHHDLNPRAYVTGVACLWIDDDKNPILTTAFGHFEQTNAATISFNDYVDFSHPKRIEHGSFSLTYPATWFLRPHETIADSETEQENYLILSGGDACACLLSVSIQSGRPDIIAREHSQALARLSSPKDGPRGVVSPERRKHQLEGAMAEYFVFREYDSMIEGVDHAALVLDTTRERLADIYLAGRVVKSNPGCKTTIEQMSQIFPSVINSFRFIPDDGASTGS